MVRENGNWKLETGNWEFENRNRKKPKFENRNSKMETGNWKMGVRLGGAVKDSWDARRHDTGAKLEGNEAKKCQKMRNEATTLLKTKEVDWERTQIRTQF